MYSRSFYSESEDVSNLPKNYDGTAFLPPAVPHEQPRDALSEETLEVGNIQSNSGGGFFSSLTHFPAFGELFGKLKMPRFGSEEILILAVAAFLFFTKEGDKECALILLFLLFIT